MKGSNKDNARQLKLEPGTHRRILSFLNVANYPEDLAYEKMTITQGEGSSIHKDNLKEMNPKRKKILDIETAKEIIQFRDREYPLGFRNLNELFTQRMFHRHILEVLLKYFSHVNFGRWVAFPVPIPRRGPGGIDGVVHAALLHTGKVLFITADETTLLWDPENTTTATFEDPVNQPHQTPDAASGYSVLCGGHSFLSDGRLIVVGGGGYGPHDKAMWGYKFDPVSKAWTRTGGSMVHHRWYPTVLTMGDQRIGNSHEVLVTCGHGAGDMEIYDEASDSFREVAAGDEKPFPNLYPGLHLLPNHNIFYSRTGWGSAGAGGGPFPSPTGGNDDQSAYFVFTGADTGTWKNIAPVSPSMPDRTKGMSVMLLSNTFPYIRVMVMGGSDPSTNNTYEIIDATSLSAAINWGASMPFPDGEHRSLGSAILLPDGTVFVCGGIQRTNSPCTFFNPQTGSWSPAAALPSIRDYHSVALLLPSGKVMMAGWNNTTIEIYSPPYLFLGPRPVISSAPTLVRHGQHFVIESTDASSIVKVVLVRPMAVTHQTDTEQKVLEMSYTHDPTHPNRLRLTAPHGGHPYSLAQQGYYMMFALNNKGVPSVAKWIYVQPSFFSPVYAQGDPGNGIGGYDLKSAADRAFAFDYDHSGNLDHMALYRPATGTMWILKNTNGSFSPVYAQGDPGNGIGGYDLASAADRAFAFDYDSNGKMDHIVLYRPGTGTMWILKNTNGSFSPVYAQGDPGNGIGGYDLASAADRAFAFDYDSNGKMDHIVLYRPGTGTMWILKNTNGSFSPVYAQGDPGNGIGGYDLKSAADRAFAFDYDSNGKMDHIVLYRPGTGTMWILKNTNGSFSPVYAQGDPGNGIGGYDLASAADRAFAFDYDHSGNLDHMALYRPATGTMWILKNTNGSFSPVYAQGDPGNGIGGYDLKSAADRAFAFDYDHSGNLDHMALYRPATGTMWVLRQQ